MPRPHPLHDVQPKGHRSKKAPRPYRVPCTNLTAARPVRRTQDTLCGPSTWTTFLGSPLRQRSAHDKIPERNENWTIFVGSCFSRARACTRCLQNHGVVLSQKDGRTWRLRRNTQGIMPRLKGKALADETRMRLPRATPPAQRQSPTRRHLSPMTHHTAPPAMRPCSSPSCAWV